ncbi:MAG: UDP-3-O-(3-hydroxymyristoyl)glucosamine N-acyltransferase [Proteobacteria bacterium]|nr:UDP-3-O-(3-hydroxymyristoyl)glucosamine N-acyltransferase [Pseudomonadota bacterium]
MDTHHLRQRFHPNAGPFSLAELAQAAGFALNDDAGALEVSGVATLHDATPEQVSFFDNPKYKDALKTTKAKAVILRPEHVAMLPTGVVALTTKAPYPTYALVAQKFHPPMEGMSGVARTATIDPDAQIGVGVSIEPGAVIGAFAVIADGAHIGAGAYIGPYVSIGARTSVGPNCTIICAVVGEHCILHPGVRIGQDGFGFAFDGKGLVKVPQVGMVIIGNHVEIGANTTIDRGAIGETSIGDGTKIDNLVQIGHNVRVGRFCQIVAQSGIAGSSVLGDFVVIGGQAAVAGHITVADGVMIAARSGVTKSLTTPREVVSGFPALPIRKWRRQQATIARLAKMKPENKDD